ncbi:MAG: hypothetical protein U1C74_23500 [Phenylobacterium sp.]|nr:hypothetical protein [Phenylobacterium sp.]
MSFVLARDARLLRDYITVEEVRGFVPGARELVQQWMQNAPKHAVYFGKLDGQLRKLGIDVNGKRPNMALMRQVFLAATFGAYVLEILDSAKAPAAIKWTSDRDAMFDRHDGLAFDLAYFFWLLIRSARTASAPPVPRLMFASPGMDGETEYAELIRLPDYLAGTLADVSLPDLGFSHEKFPPLFSQLFVEASNNAIINILMGEGRLTTRRLLFGSPRRAWQPLQPGAWEAGADGE